MALFGGARDVSFITKINRELLYKVIDTEVGFYKLVLEETRANIYGEGTNKVYYQPLRFPLFVDRQASETLGTDFGLDTNVVITFYILKDTATTLNLLPEQGDIINWDGKFYELDNISENKYVVGKNPDTWIKGDGHGASIQYECAGHAIREAQIQILDVEYGSNLGEYEFPDNM